MHVYDLKKGESLVRAARMSIELYLKNPHFDKNTVKNTLRDFNEHNGLFVTLEYYMTHELRGCIGFIGKWQEIKNSIVDAALSAAFEDPRFIPISLHELDEIIIEVSILSEMIKIKGDKEKILRAVKAGRDGLMIKYGIYSGLLLPNVATDEGWNAEEFLENVCIKAGLKKEYWSYPNADLYIFQTQRFKETDPNGKIVEIKSALENNKKVK